jgi:hypothetical protein
MIVLTGLTILVMKKFEEHLFLRSIQNYKVRNGQRVLALCMNIFMHFVSYSKQGLLPYEISPFTFIFVVDT